MIYHQYFKYFIVRNISNIIIVIFIISIPLHFCSVSRQCVTGEEAARWSPLSDQMYTLSKILKTFKWLLDQICAVSLSILSHKYISNKYFRCFEVFSPDQVGLPFIKTIFYDKHQTLQPKCLKPFQAIFQHRNISKFPPAFGTTLKKNALAEIVVGLPSRFPWRGGGLGGCCQSGY